jgi:hypothetical protein
MRLVRFPVWPLSAYISRCVLLYTINMERESYEKALSGEDPFQRTRVSRLLSELRKEKRQAISILDPARKMMAAFSLSIEARKLRIAGLRSQGFTGPEIDSIIKTRRP